MLRDLVTANNILPQTFENPQLKEVWSLTDSLCDDQLDQAIRHAVRFCAWQWPEKPVLFFADPHADKDAFLGSLELSGGIETVDETGNIRLTAMGQAATFIIGGDCLDKGPSNLELLRSLRQLMTSGANVKLLAGNHDVRLLVGLKALNQTKTALNEHLFLRMGPKVIPFFAEIYQEYLANKPLPKNIPSEADCRLLMYPSENWADRFSLIAGYRITEKTIAKEIKRIQEKVDCFAEEAAIYGLTLRQVYAAALQSYQLFILEDGEFSWFFKEMQLGHQEGSFLFIHAGLDDSILNVLSAHGIDGLNAGYQAKLEEDLFDFYFGPFANTLRTKYRDDELSLTSDGVDNAFRQGIHAVVHGHRNHHFGQCLSLRSGLLHIESDITMDRNSRFKEGLSGIGHGVTVIHPEGQVMGISRDHPYIKLFEPSRYLL